MRGFPRIAFHTIRVQKQRYGNKERGGKSMSPVIWILIGAVLLACLGGGKGKKKPEAGGPVRIDHPH